MLAGGSARRVKFGEAHLQNEVSHVVHQLGLDIKHL
jgi:hypothetical protein